MTLLAFSQARTILGFSEIETEAAPHETPAQVLARFIPNPAPLMAMARVALDLEYVDWHQPIGSAHEMAIIPPVSGG